MCEDPVNEISWTGHSDDALCFGPSIVLPLTLVSRIEAAAIDISTESGCCHRFDVLVQQMTFRPLCFLLSVLGDCILPLPPGRDSILLDDHLVFCMS
jgi:hypothetical protein